MITKCEPLLGEEEKASFHNSKAELTSGTSPLAQLQRNYHRLHAPPPIRPAPHTPPTPMVTSSATGERVPHHLGERSSILRRVGNSTHSGLGQLIYYLSIYLSIYLRSSYLKLQAKDPTVVRVRFSERQDCLSYWA